MILAMGALILNFLTRGVLVQLLKYAAPAFDGNVPTGWTVK